jgi:PAS domain S-box-containing protein
MSSAGAVPFDDERARRVQKAGRIGGLDWDLITGESVGTPVFHELYGLPLDMPLTHSAWRELLHAGDVELFDARLAAALAGGTCFECEFRANRRDTGETRWFVARGDIERDVAGRAVCMVSAHLDITERKLAEERLRDSEARLRTIFERTSDFIVVADLDQRITACNPAAAASLGYSTDEMVGRSLRDFVGEAEFEHGIAQLRAKLEGGGTTRYELTVRDRHGAPRLWEINSSLSLDATGQPVGVHILGRDITEARAAQAALAASEGRLRRAQEAGGVGSYEWDLATGEGVLSDSMLRIAGLEPGRRYTLKEMLAPVLEEDMPQVRATIDAIGQGAERRETEYRLRRPSDGALRWIRDIGQVERDADGKPVRWVGIIQDVTEGKTAELALRASEARLRLIADALPVLLSYVDAEGRYRFVNKGYEHWYRRASDEILGMHMRELVGSDRYEVMRPYVEAALAGRSVHFETRGRYPVGEREVLVDYVPQVGGDGTVEGFYVLATDITERKATENAVRERAAELEAVLDAVPAAIWIARDPEAQHVDGNQLARDLLRAEPGADLSETMPDGVHKPPFRVFRPDGSELPPEELPVRAAARGEPVRDFEARVVFDDGTEISLMGNATQLTDGQGRPRGSVAALLDVTALKKIERELRELTQVLEQRVAEAVAERETALAQLHEAQKLETLGQLTGGVAHDFNNLLTPIVGALDLLRRRLPDDPRTTRLIDAALQAADRGQTLVARLLAFGRRQVLQPRAVDVAELLHSLTDLIQRSIGRHIGVVVDPAAGLPPARVDPNQLELAILNLSLNARDAMPGGGTLTITAHAEKVGPVNDQRLKPGDYVRLSVVDTGTGMDEDTLKRAVEPFFTTKGVGKGTGLGLSMIHGLVGQLGGALTLSSTLSAGTRVDLWLPVAETAPAPPPTTEPGPMCVLPKTATVLLVDDDALVRLGAAEMLSELGYGVVEASSGAAAMQAIEGDGPIDVLVTDYLMPGINGGELIEAARRRRPGLPALIVSGYANVAGLPPDVPMLAKPFRHDDLAAQVAALIDPSPDLASPPHAAGPAR